MASGAASASHQSRHRAVAVVEAAILLRLLSLHIMHAGAQDVLTNDAGADLHGEGRYLLAWRDSLDGFSPEGEVAAWSEDISPCQWPGVTCRAELGPVATIALFDSQLDGLLPLFDDAAADGNTTGGNQAALFHGLQVIEMLGNRGLRGALPSSWSNLKALQSIIISESSLTGTLPVEWSSMGSLTDVRVSMASLSSSLPSGWSQLSQIQAMDFRGAGLTGTLPAAYSTLTQLTSIHGGYNSLVGSIPPEWSMMGALLRMVLSANSLTGPVPAQLSALANLRHLSLEGNKLSGPLPVLLATAITVLDLKDNSFDSGPLPAEWSVLTALMSMDVSGTQRTGQLPGEYSRLGGLMSLSVAQNSMSGSIPASWQVLHLMKHLDLQDNSFSFDELPWDYPPMVSLYLGGNAMSAGTLTGSKIWGKLKELDLSRNALSGTVPDAQHLRQHLPMLSLLNLSANNLSGTLPDGWIGAGDPALRLMLDGNSVCLPNDDLYSGGTSLFSGVYPCPGTAPAPLASSMLFLVLGIAAAVLLLLALCSAFGLWRWRRMQLELMRQRSHTARRPPHGPELQLQRSISLQSTAPLPAASCCCCVGPPRRAEEQQAPSPGGSPYGSVKAHESIGLFLVDSIAPEAIRSMEGPRAVSSLPDIQEVSQEESRSFSSSVASAASALMSSFLLEARRGSSNSNLQESRPSEIALPNRANSDGRTVGSLGMGRAGSAPSTRPDPLAQLSPSPGHSSMAPAAGPSSADLRVNFFKEIEPNLERKLGEGSYGEVFRARWRGQKVAVKVFNRNIKGSDKEHLLISFGKEVELLVGLQDCPFIVKILGACLQRPKVCIIYEYVGGGSLSDRIYNDSGPLTPHEVMTIAHDVASGLSHLHPRVIHRDLKPQNILLTRRGRAKIIDFGISRMKDPFQSHVHTDGHVGTPYYMAPEVYEGHTTEKVDVYALGIIINECLARVQPFKEYHHTLQVTVKCRRPAMAPGMPEQLGKLVAKCWAADPRDRPSCSEVCKLLEYIMEDEAARQQQGTEAVDSSRKGVGETQSEGSSAQHEQKDEAGGTESGRADDGGSVCSSDIMQDNSTDSARVGPVARPRGDAVPQAAIDDAGAREAADENGIALKQLTSRRSSIASIPEEEELENATLCF